MPLTTEWVKIEVPIKVCTSIELIGDVTWEWCTDREGAKRTVGPLVKEVLIDTKIDVLTVGMSLCWVRADQPGTLWRKFF
jgi:hypothetical protein